jgi:hypothetical protein
MLTEIPQKKLDEFKLDQPQSHVVFTCNKNHFSLVFLL